MRALRFAHHSMNAVASVHRIDSTPFRVWFPHSTGRWETPP